MRRFRPFKWLREACSDPYNHKYSAGRIATLWVVFVQANIMLVLVAKGLFPANEAVKLILGLLSGPAIIYSISSRYGAIEKKEENGPNKSA